MSVSTAVVRPAQVPGAERVALADVIFDASYAEGGEPLTPAQLGLRTVTFAICQIRNGSESEEFVAEAWYSPAQQKIHLISGKTGKEVASGKDMSKVNVRVTAWGK